MKRLVATVARGALKAKKINKRQLAFKLKVTDVRGKKTRLTVRAPAHD